MEGHPSVGEPNRASNGGFRLAADPDRGARLLGCAGRMVLPPAGK